MENSPCARPDASALCQLIYHYLKAKQLEQSGLGHSAGSRPNVEDPGLDPGSFPESSCQVLYPPCGHCHRDDMTGVLFCFFILAEQGQWGLDDVVGK